MPDTGLLDLDPGIHQCHGACTNGSHGRRTVGFKDIGNHPDGITIVGRDHPFQCAVGQVTVTDLAAADAP